MDYLMASCAAKDYSPTLSTPIYLPDWNVLKYFINNELSLNLAISQSETSSSNPVTSLSPSGNFVRIAW